MTAPDLETKSRRLFQSTCELLGLKPKDLTLAQRLRVSRASALRLQLDDLEKAQLLGQPIDINKLVEASEALERLISHDGPEDGSPRALAAARANLEALIARHLEANERNEHDELARLRSENERLAVEVSELRERPRRLDNRRPPNPEPRPDNVVPIAPNATRPPDHYLKAGQPREAWRDFVEGTTDSMTQYRNDRWSPPRGW